VKWVLKEVIIEGGKEAVKKVAEVLADILKGS
jgi:hypothetical protein